MTDSFVAHASDLTAMIGICVGLAAWWFAREDAARSSAELERYKVDSLARTAKLENETAQAKLELARIDPKNVPIRSIKADLFVFASGDFLEQHLKEMPSMGLGDSLSLNSEGKYLALLHCTKVTTVAATSTSRADDGTEIRVEGWTFTMSFEWPSPNWVDSIDDFKNWIDRNNASTSDLDRTMDSCVFSLPGAKGSGKIINGSLILIINGHIRREIELPASFDQRQITGKPAANP